jgi:hypothetical protein
LNRKYTLPKCTCLCKDKIGVFSQNKTKGGERNSKYSEAVYGWIRRPCSRLYLAGEFRAQLDWNSISIQPRSFDSKTTECGSLRSKAYIYTMAWWSTVEPCATTLL